MTSFSEALQGASAADRHSHRPVLFRPTLRADRVALEDLLKDRPHLTVVDQLHRQLTELVKVLDPSIRFTTEELEAAAQAHLGATPIEEYGVWVYYPWNDRLVHLLDESEFALVRTDRNRNKITREEQAVLAAKKVGIIGLSVGQSVSIALTLERGYGELRLADFDTLDLSNLNRIRSGVNNLGMNKAIVAAREIAEIDPFLRVVCYTSGITADNIDGFLTDGGKLDLLIEECDNVAVKILARQKAKALHIPVIMDTSDRGLIDVERFDLEPERPIMHGFLDGLDLSLIHGPMSRDQQVHYIMAMVDQDGLSARMKRSLPAIGSTLSTWPQLGGHVMLGGALTSEIARNISLGNMPYSGRWYNDLDELLTKENSVVADPPSRKGKPVGELK